MLSSPSPFAFFCTFEAGEAEGGRRRLVEQLAGDGDTAATPDSTFTTEARSSTASCFTERAPRLSEDAPLLNDDAPPDTGAPLAPAPRPRPRWALRPRLAIALWASGSTWQLRATSHEWLWNVRPKLGIMLGDHPKTPFAFCICRLAPELLFLSSPSGPFLAVVPFLSTLASPPTVRPSQTLPKNPPYSPSHNGWSYLSNCPFTSLPS